VVIYKVSHRTPYLYKAVLMWHVTNVVNNYRLNEEDNNSSIVQLEFTTDTGVAALQLVKDWSCRLVQSCDTHEKLIQLLRNNKGGEQYTSSTLPRQHNPDEPVRRNSHFSRASRLLSSLRQKSTRKRRRKFYLLRFGSNSQNALITVSGCLSSWYVQK